MYKRNLYPVILLVLLFSSALPVLAQKDDCPAGSIGIWLNCQVTQVAGTRLNQQANNKQSEAPSIADSSTSLVDQTSAPDVLGIAVNLAGLSAGSKDSGKDNSAMSFTTSAYALYASLRKHDPLDPAFYSAYPNLRRFYFTLGQETPEDSKTPEKDKATLIGTKILLINQRDVSRDSNRQLLEVMNNRLGQMTSDFSIIAREVEDYLYLQLVPVADRAAVTKTSFTHNQLSANFQALRDSLTPDQLKAIRNLISNHIESRVALDEENLRAIDKIKNAPELALTFQSKLRKGSGTDEYRAGLAYDYGLNRRTNLTLNGTFDYADSKITGGDKRGGRFAGEANFQLNEDRNPLGGTGPFMFTVSGEGKWLTNTTPTYTGQLKLTIPIFNGISFPISFSVANRTDLIKEKTVRGHFGFSFDLTKLLNGLR
ncbi:MAG: hypothetical protein QOJ02_550 [Acidobacteriota bacterium]|jgi:hypothetical protein|nr:hypothetical protein [Acidobacteriota bacterium]